MKYLFDSSAVYTMLGPRMIGKLVGNYTLELCRYELCNVIWKDCALLKKITLREQETLADLTSHTLNSMVVLGIKGHEKKIISLADRLGLSAYDASYAYFARALDTQLVTADKRLAAKAKDYVKVTSAEML
jgi:predicted nucleic acid-binding protein